MVGPKEVRTEVDTSLKKIGKGGQSLCVKLGGTDTFILISGKLSRGIKTTVLEKEYSSLL